MLLQKQYLNIMFWNQVGAYFKTTKLFSSGTSVIKVRFERAHLIRFFWSSVSSLYSRLFSRPKDHTAAKITPAAMNPELSTHLHNSLHPAPFHLRKKTKKKQKTKKTKKKQKNKKQKKKKKQNHWHAATKITPLHPIGEEYRKKKTQKTEKSVWVIRNDDSAVTKARLLAGSWSANCGDELWRT